jgi:CDP-4-dehydro-6-deoxyglucose reductase
LRDHVYKVASYHLLTPTVAQIFLYPETIPGLCYAAGQYIKVVHPDQSASPFSLASAPAASSMLELHLLFLKENYRAMEVLRQVKENKQLILRGPYGSCIAQQLDCQRPLIFLARGTGFAPIKAVIEALVQQPAYPPMHFYWSVPHWRDVYLHEQLEHWAKTLPDFHFTIVLSREFLPPDKTLKFGKIPAAVLQDHPDLSFYQVYASGPENMIYSALYDFQQHGLARASFHSDVFDYKPF